MPYNPYYAPGYQPQVPAYPSVPQNIQPQQPQTPGGGLIWVQGENGAKSYLLAPSTTVLLMDSEADRFYIKSSDASGMPLPLRVFEYHEMAQNGSKIDFKGGEGIDARYVTKDEFDALKRIVEGLKGDRDESAV